MSTCSKAAMPEVAVVARSSTRSWATARKCTISLSPSRSASTISSRTPCHTRNRAAAFFLAESGRQPRRRRTFGSTMISINSSPSFAPPEAWTSRPTQEAERRPAVPWETAEWSGDPTRRPLDASLAGFSVRDDPQRHAGGVEPGFAAQRDRFRRFGRRQRLAGIDRPHHAHDGLGARARLLGDQTAPAMLFPVLHVGRQDLGVEHVAAATVGQRAAAFDQELADAMSAEALDDGQPLGHGKGLEPAHAQRAHRLVADTGDDVSGTEIVAVELLGVRHVQFADEAGGAHRESLQRVFHPHSEFGGDGLAADRLWDSTHDLLSQLVSRSTRGVCGLEAPRAADFSRTPSISIRSSGRLMIMGRTSSFTAPSIGTRSQ